MRNWYSKKAECLCILPSVLITRRRVLQSQNTRELETPCSHYASNCLRQFCLVNCYSENLFGWAVLTTPSLYDYSYIFFVCLFRCFKVLNLCCYVCIFDLYLHVSGPHAWKNSIVAIYDKAEYRHPAVFILYIRK